MGKKLICIFLCLFLMINLASCANTDGSAGQAASESPASDEVQEASVAPDIPMNSSSGEAGAASPSLSDPELAQQIQDILAELDFSDEGFLTQEDFYRALGQILNLHAVELSPSQTSNAQFCFNYSNVTDVRLLTMSQTAEQIQEDVEAARRAVEESESSQRPELKLNEDAVMESAEAVRESHNYVTSFVITSTTEQDDQTLMFLAASAALAILDPNYDNTETAFHALRGNLFNLYNNSGGNAVSWIDGIDNSKSFVIPGNAIECWLGLMDDGNFYLAITPYARYDEIIDIAGQGGTPLG